MKNIYTEKPICLCSDLASRMTCLRYYSYLCFLVVQENQNTYLKERNRSVLQDLSSRFSVLPAEPHTLQGKAWSCNFNGAFDTKEKKTTKKPRKTEL